MFPFSPACAAKMHTTSFLIGIFISVFLLFQPAKSDEGEVKIALTDFMKQMMGNSSCLPKVKSPWNLTSDSGPCTNNWVGVTCDNRFSLKNLTLDGYRFPGYFNPISLCNVQSIADSLTVISLEGNSLRGDNLGEIIKCRQLTRLFLKANSFSGELPGSFSKLRNLKRLDISGNNFTGNLPDLAGITGLTEFSAQDNSFSGKLPDFELSNFETFNISNNRFHGGLPNGAERFPVSSFLNNPKLCGEPLKNNCTSSRHGPSTNDILMYSGFSLLGLTFLIAIVLCFFKKRKKVQQSPVQNTELVKVGVVDHGSMNKSSSNSLSIDHFKPSIVSKSEVLGDQSTIDNSASVVVMTYQEENELDFENLLKAPAELLGRGKHGSVYKVVSEDLGKTLVVKRVRDWGISSDNFKQRMERLSQLKHPYIISAIAFYSSRLEKLLIYEYQENGNLLSLLLGTQMGKVFDWGSRLRAAATIADALAFMHQELHQYGIAHGNLKSSNIFLNKNMDPSISEYGLMVDPEDPSFVATSNLYQGNGENHFAFKADIYAFGVILLELLTGKNMIQSNGLDLATWVVSVVKEEWTVEVFDKKLVQEGAHEGRMVSLLQIGIKCVNPSLQARPSINQIVLMINTLKDEEERCMDVSGITSMYFQV